jgi:hypothetical protein
VTVPVEPGAGAPKPIQDWLVKLLPVGILGGVAYAVVHLTYVQFYAKFGLLPEEVGIGRTEMLSQALVGPVVAVLTYGVFITAVVTAVLAFTRQLTLGSFLRWAGVCAAVACLMLFGFMAVRAGQVGARAVDQGESVRTVYLGFPLVSVPLLDTRALPVSVQWKDTKKTPAALTGGTGCMFYLGQAGDRAVLYDVKHRRVVRFDASDAVILTSRLPAHLPAHCRPG